MVDVLQSYAGKYIPALAYKIHQTNPSATMKINLKGVAIGEGLCDPINVRYTCVLSVLNVDKVAKVNFIPSNIFFPSPQML